MTKILQNLVKGKWCKAKKYSEIINVLDGKINYKVPDTSISEISPFIKSIQSVSKSGLHNPFKNPERYQMLGDVCFRTAHSLHNKNTKDKIIDEIISVTGKTEQQAEGELIVSRKFLENFSIFWWKKRMDDIDRKLLTLLQVNADLPLSEIAKRVGISSTPCWNRIKKLEEQGVIKYKVSIVDKEKVGYAVTVFLSISVSNHNSDWFSEFEKVVMRHNNILEVHRLTGSSADYLLKIIAKSIEEYDAFQQQLISEIQFTGMSSSISLKEVKNSKQIPV